MFLCCCCCRTTRQAFCVMSVSPGSSTCQRPTLKVVCVVSAWESPNSAAAPLGTENRWAAKLWMEKGGVLNIGYHGLFNQSANPFRCSMQSAETFISLSLTYCSYGSQVRGGVNGQLFTLSNSANTQTISDGISQRGSSEIVYRSFSNVQNDIYYWVLPGSFRGDKVRVKGKMLA